MIFQNISTEKKLETLNSAKVAHEEALYDSILRVGLDPDLFDPETFDKNDPTLPSNLSQILEDIERSINSIIIINREISQIGS
jgi:hypothetical protein